MKVVVLSLKDATIRREYMQSVLSKQNIQFEFINSLSPQDIDPKLFENTPFYLSNEAVATFETHRMVLQMVKDSGETTLVLEDDATPLVKSVLDEIDFLVKTELIWDIMLVGYTQHIRIDKYLINDYFVKLAKFIGMHSYIITPEGAAKILTVLGEPNEHVDRRISVLIRVNQINGIFSKKKIFSQNNLKFKTQIPKKKHLLR